MNLKLRWWGVVVVGLALNAFSLAQTAAAPAKKRHARPAAAPAATQEDVQALRDLVQSQQKQIEAQRQQMQQLQDQLHQVLDAVVAAAFQDVECAIQRQRPQRLRLPLHRRTLFLKRRARKNRPN